MTMETKEVVSSAVKLEQDGIEFYEDAAGKSGNSLAQKMFRSLADDERAHIRWIQQHTDEEIDGNAVSDRYRRLLEGIFKGAEGVVREVAEHSLSDLEAADLALAMEKKSVEAYQKWAEEAETPQVKNLCLKIRDYEQFHHKVIQNMILYFQQPGDWFMEEEQWNFEGG